MPEPAGFPLSIGTALAESAAERARATRPDGPRVVGKVMLVISALGMCLVLASLWRGAWFQAGLIFLATLLGLELMLQRAVALFHASYGTQTDHAAQPAPERRIYATAGD